MCQAILREAFARHREASVEAGCHVTVRSGGILKIVDMLPRSLYTNDPTVGV